MIATTFWKRIRTGLARIHLVDKFLMVFMALLMFQSVRSLFAGNMATGESAHIDIVVRTSTAAIFGYFLSTNFIRHSSNGSRGGAGGAADRAKSIPTPSGGGIQSRIGFADPDSDGSANAPELGGAGYEEQQGPEESGVSRLQIIITSVIGLFCLTVLIIARDISALNADMAMSASAAATGAQFRDIVSGCIGFLIGCPTVSTNQFK